MSTAFFTHADCRRHDMGAGHRVPAAAGRDRRPSDRHRAGHRADAPRRAAGRPEGRRAGARTRYVAELRDLLQQIEASGEHQGARPDTAAAPGLAAALSAGRPAVAATDAVLDGRAANAFCAVRPSATTRRDQAMGFCFFNNVAVAPRARDVRGLERVAIIDFDVHHGNGTEGHRRRRRAHADVQLLPGPARTVQRRDAPGDQHGQPAGPALHARRRGPELIEANWMPALRRLPAADGVHLRRLRRTARTISASSGWSRADYSGSRCASGMADPATPGPASSRAWKAAATLSSLARSVIACRVPHRRVSQRRCAQPPSCIINGVLRLRVENVCSRCSSSCQRNS